MVTDDSRLDQAAVSAVLEQCGEGEVSEAEAGWSRYIVDAVAACVSNVKPEVEHSGSDGV